MKKVTNESMRRMVQTEETLATVLARRKQICRSCRKRFKWKFGSTGSGGTNRGKERKRKTSKDLGKGWEGMEWV